MQVGAYGIRYKSLFYRGYCTGKCKAKEIKREELGNLSVGSVADIAIFTLKKGNFGFIDSHNYLLKGTQKLETELTIRAGKIVYDLNGIGGRTDKESTILTIK